MDYNLKYKSVDEPLPSQQQQPPLYRQQHQSSTLTYFTQQAIRVSAGYMAPHSGNALDHFQHQSANLHEAMRREIENPTIMREAIMREIEKERIREEIIAEEMTRRRILEYEVRRELLMERQLAKLSGEGFPPFPSPVMSFSPTLPFLKQQSDARCIEERITRSLEGRMGKEISVSGLGARNEIRRLDIVPFEERISEIPFQQRSVEPKVSALKPVSHSAERMISELQPSLEPSKEKDRIILLGKPNTSLSGAKRKAITPLVEVASKPPSCSVPKTNGKEDWSCALCQVSATSERGLNDHLQGKKHKSKEAALISQRNGKNYSIGLFPKKTKVDDYLNVKPKVEFLPGTKSVEGTSLEISEKEGTKDNVTPSSQHHADRLGKGANAAQEKQKTKQTKKKKFKFWCATCKVGALSEKSMEAHRTGKKHMARLQELNDRGIATSTTKVESTQTVNETPKDVEKTEVTDDVGATVNRINPEEQEAVTTSDN
ncbi:uncharacterized protein [Nicotiana sylvestris]|uniref:Myosin-11-like isoform X1 n=1 Tax=Nicotiana sylvestris TaxID=4096 RepID=A0A1U7XK22_NICSY|nr:PREDICTED: myosin-11-like isoform X1 [Nicotiana sylvestris]